MESLKLNRFCRCFSIQAGAVIVATFGLVGSLSVIYMYIAVLGQPNFLEEFLKSSEIVLELVDFQKRLNTFNMTVLTLAVLTNGSLLVGFFRQAPKVIGVGLAGELGLLLTLIVSAVVIFIWLCIKSVKLAFIFLAFYAPVNVMAVYFVLVIYSAYLEIKENSKNIVVSALA